MQSGMLEKVRMILTTGTNRESFFKIISRLFPPMDPRYTEIQKVYDDMKDAFRQKSRESGERYFEHLRSVALIMINYLMIKDFELIMAGILHDGPEDIEYWPVARVRREFGDRVAMYVERLKKGDVAEFSSKKERDHVYHQLFQTADCNFFLIKLSDRLHNLLTQDACPKEKIRRKVEETRLYYLPYAERHRILYHELLATVEELEDKYLKEEDKTECCGASPVCV